MRERRAASVSSRRRGRTSASTANSRDDAVRPADPARAGKHWVTLTHPDAPPVEREVTIRRAKR